jgi:hypothetical protein
MATEISTALERTQQELLQVIAGFTPGQFNTVPFQDSWTAGQVAEHILKFSSGGAEILSSPGTTTFRDPAEKIAPLRDLFLNFNIKMTAPDFIQPSADAKEQGIMSTLLDNSFTPMVALSQTQNLSLTYADFDLPQFGTLTRMEWLYFILFHTQRHIRQMKNIRGWLEG